MGFPLSKITGIGPYLWKIFWKGSGVWKCNAYTRLLHYQMSKQI